MLAVYSLCLNRLKQCFQSSHLTRQKSEYACFPKFLTIPSRGITKSELLTDVIPTATPTVSLFFRK